MKRLLLVAAGLALAAALFAEDGGRTVDDAWLKAITANDLDAVVALYADDATFCLDGMESKGKDAIRKAYVDMLGPNVVKEVKLLDRHYQSSGDVSGSWGRAAMTLAPKSGTGAPMTVEVCYTSVSVKRGGKWMYIIDHASAPPRGQP